MYFILVFISLINMFLVLSFLIVMSSAFVSSGRATEFTRASLTVQQNLANSLRTTLAIYLTLSVSLTTLSVKLLLLVSDTSRSSLW